MEHALISRLRFTLNRLREHLWVKPLISCVSSVLLVFLAGAADHIYLTGLPDISADSIEALLSINTASMLVIATFTVGSMLSAYTSASEAATPRSFAVVIADDISQHALSTFIAAFIFSVVALTAILNQYYGTNGRFVLFCMIMALFAIVILSFLRWVDSIARLGRLGTVIGKVEARTAQTFRKRAILPLAGCPPHCDETRGDPIETEQIGYVQRIDLGILEAWAAEADVIVCLEVLPGDFVVPQQTLARVWSANAQKELSLAAAREQINRACVIDDTRTFDEDPAFGLVVLSEIASRALSPAVNDPGSAIAITRSYVKLFHLWHEAGKNTDNRHHNTRIHVPARTVDVLFDIAFDPLCRDGANAKEVVLTLIRSLEAIARVDALTYERIAKDKIRLTADHALNTLSVPSERRQVERAVERALNGS